MRFEKRMEDDFKDHKAEYSVYSREDGDDTIEVLRWRKPGSSMYYVQYIMKGGNLFVSGDLGEAIYQWYECQSLEWVSKLDLSYFKGKCQASEVGRDFSDWDEGEAEKRIQEHFKEYYDEENRENMRDNFERTGGTSSLFNEQDWHIWLNEYGYQILGSEYYEYGNVGKVISYRCEAHLFGLKMAMEQLAQEAQK